MAQYPIHRKSYLGVSPTSGGGSTVHAMNVKKGTRIIFASIMPLINGIGGDTLAVRVNTAGGGAANGIYTATDPAGWTVGTPINCAGSDITGGGFLVNADTTIDVVYSGSADSTAMKYRLNVGMIVHETTN